MSIASAHVSVSPRQSKAGATEQYIVRVPTEGNISTVSVDLEVPPGVTIQKVTAPDGAQYEVRREGSRIVAITWKIEIKPRESAELPFTAENPKDAIAISWKARQHFADGTTVEWVGPPGDRRPAAVTKLAAADGDEHTQKPISVIGTVVDTGCYMVHDSTGPDHAACAAECAKNGVPLAIVDAAGKLYILAAADHKNPNTLLLPFVEKTVRLTGILFEKGSVGAIAVKTITEQ
ncbi:MAG TPA: DUF1775 domain-containing protein [Terriglobales bacterium]|nr:DUF1775 domain-containing protein [Terriglobales bacterium]